MIYRRATRRAFYFQNQWRAITFYISLKIYNEMRFISIYQVVAEIVCPISGVLMFVTLNAVNRTVSHGGVSYIYNIVILNLIGIYQLI